MPYLPTYNFYMRIAALQAQEPLSGKTVILGNYGSREIAKRVKKNSRRMYAIVYQPAEDKQEAKAETPKTKKSERKRFGSLKV